MGRMSFAQMVQDLEFTGSLRTKLLGANQLSLLQPETRSLEEELLQPPRATIEPAIILPI